MTAIIFAGPSLPPSSAPANAELEWRPPVCQGDLYQAALSRPVFIGLIDGYFELVPTVWHKEILWAMAQGIHVYGAGSIGALRAAELADFGMKGIGHIFQQFHSAALLDDDEVAVLHGPAEVNYVQITEAMVNVRATIDQAIKLGIIESALAASLVWIAKRVFYKERTYDVILKTAIELGIDYESLRAFANWLPNGKIDQKRLDAIEMVQTIIQENSRGIRPLQVSYQFAHTFAWEHARRRTDANVDPA